MPRQHTSISKVRARLRRAIKIEDPEQFRERVEKIEHLLTYKPKPQGRATTKIRFNQVNQYEWRLDVHHKDADRVDEIWADFLSRKPSISSGPWTRESRFERVGTRKIFTFRTPPPKKKVYGKTTEAKPKKKVSKESVKAAMQNMDAADREALLAALRASLK